MRYDRFLERFGIPDPALAQRLNDHYAQYFTGRKNVLDAGCGQGLFLDALARADIPGQGVDMNEAFCKALTARGMTCHHQNIFDFLADCEPARYNGLYASHLIEHLTLEQLERFLELSVRVLCPGGRFVLVFPDCESLPMQLYAFWKDPTHVRFYHKEFVVFALEELGFKAGVGDPFDLHLLANQEPVPLFKRTVRYMQRFVQRQLGIAGKIKEIEELTTKPVEACVVADLQTQPDDTAGP